MLAKRALLLFFLLVSICYASVDVHIVNQQLNNTIGEQLLTINPNQPSSIEIELTNHDNTSIDYLFQSPDLASITAILDNPSGTLGGQSSTKITFTFLSATNGTHSGFIIMQFTFNGTVTKSYSFKTTVRVGNIFSPTDSPSICRLNLSTSDAYYTVGDRVVVTSIANHEGTMKISLYDSGMFLRGRTTATTANGVAVATFAVQPDFKNGTYTADVLFTADGKTCSTFDFIKIPVLTNNTGNIIIPIDIDISSSYILNDFSFCSNDTSGVHTCASGKIPIGQEVIFTSFDVSNGGLGTLNISSAFFDPELASKLKDYLAVSTEAQAKFANATQGVCFTQWQKWENQSQYLQSHVVPAAYSQGYGTGMFHWSILGMFGGAILILLYVRVKHERDFRKIMPW